MGSAASASAPSSLAATLSFDAPPLAHEESAAARAARVQHHLDALEKPEQGNDGPAIVALQPAQWDALLSALFHADDGAVRDRVRTRLQWAIMPDKSVVAGRKPTVRDVIDAVEDEAFKESVTRKAKVKFDQLDADGSGYLEAKEIRALADWVLDVEKALLNFTLDMHALRVSIMRRLDFSADGKLCFAEFSSLFEEVYRKEVRARGVPIPLPACPSCDVCRSLSPLAPLVGLSMRD